MPALPFVSKCRLYLLGEQRVQFSASMMVISWQTARARMTCTTRRSQRESSANTSKSAWSCESLPGSAVPALVRGGRCKGPAQHLCGGLVQTSPEDGPASLSATTTLNAHAILLGASSLTSAAVRRWHFHVPVKEISYRYILWPTGLWTLVGRAGGAPVVPPGTVLPRW